MAMLGFMLGVAGLFMPFLPELSPSAKTKSGTLLVKLGGMLSISVMDLPQKNGMVCPPNHCLPPRRFVKLH